MPRGTGKRWTPEEHAALLQVLRPTNSTVRGPHGIDWKEVQAQLAREGFAIDAERARKRISNEHIPIPKFALPPKRRVTRDKVHALRKPLAPRRRTPLYLAPAPAVTIGFCPNCGFDLTHLREALAAAALVRERSK